MKPVFSRLLAVLGLGFLTLSLALPAVAADKSAKKTETTPAPVTSPDTPHVQATAPAVAPATATTPPPSPEPPKPAVQAIPESVTYGDMTLSHGNAVYSHGHIDFFLSIKNKGKFDETVTGAGSMWDNTDIVEVKKDKDGKEQETSIAEVIPAGEKVDFTDGKMWFRLKGVKKAPKDTDVLLVTFYFRHSANTEFRMAFKDSSASEEKETSDKGGSAQSKSFTQKIIDWFKK